MSNTNENLGPADELLASIRPEDRVTILIHNGTGRNGPEWKEKTGRCVIAPSRNQEHAVLNMGGQHGTPGIADHRNLVRVGKRIATPEIETQLRDQSTLTEVG